MTGSALTTSKKILSHLRPFNLQVIIDESVPWFVLAPYRWAFGLTDFSGNIVYSYSSTPMRQFQPVNEDGVLIYPKIMADPQGGTFTLNGFCPNHEVYLGDPSSNHNASALPFRLLKTCRYGKVDGSRLLFNASPIRSSVTATSIGGSNTVTAGGKVGGSVGVVTAEGNSSFQRNFGSQNNADTVPGELVGLSLSWSRQ